jgi:uncharacterized membrane protein YdjX (TVP38/TMEM64 family)
MPSALTKPEPEPSTIAVAWWRRLLASPAVPALVMLVVLGGLLVFLLRSFGGVDALRDRFGAYAALIVIPVHAVVAISPFPSEVMAFGNAAVFGFWAGAALSWAGWMTAALVHYSLVRRVARDLDLERHRSRFPRWLRRFPVGHPAFLIFGRYVPYGPQLVATAAGALAVPFARFACCQAAAIVPVALFFAALATAWLDF